MKDQYERSVDGICAVARGVRTVRDGKITINGSVFRGDCLALLEGAKVAIQVRDWLATVYVVRDLETWEEIGEIKLLEWKK